MERPCSGQTESVLWGEPQCVRLGAYHHTSRALKWHSTATMLHMMMMKMMKRKSRSWASAWGGVKAFQPHMSWIKRLWLQPAARARCLGAFWVSTLVLDYPGEGFKFKGSSVDWVRCRWSGQTDGHWEGFWTVLQSAWKDDDDVLTQLLP